MVHQLIFTNPKPGMTVKGFQKRWINNHAVNFASKIAQIVRYKIDTVVQIGSDKPVFWGAAEIWMNEEDQPDTLLAPEYINGARQDEPNWAAFWETIALNTDAHVIVDGVSMSPNPSGVKLITLIKRKEGTTLNDFRNYSLQNHASIAKQLPGLKGYYQCLVNDGHYVVGESNFDAVYMMWFDNMAALEEALNTAGYKNDLLKFAEKKYIFHMAAEEHWIIGPELREY